MRTVRHGRLALVAMVVLMVSGQAEASPRRAPGDAAALKLGRDLLKRDCGACHATGARGDSPRREAPAFRHLSQNYDVEALGEALAEGLMTGHPEMPEFRFAPHEVDAILRYLRSVQAPPAASPSGP